MEKFVKFAEGYGKVNPSDDETISVPYKSPSRRRHTTDNTLCLSAVIITAMVGATVVHHQRTKSSKSEQFSSIKSSNSIKAVCAAMHNPGSCFTSISTISSANAVDPEMVFNLTLRW
ncbi:hypothetical protein R6Q57_028143 [Mikania cordata]